MRQDIGIELVGVIAALLLAFLLASTDETTQAYLTIVLVVAAWAAIAYGLCWLTIMGLRGLRLLWSEPLNGAAKGMR